VRTSCIQTSKRPKGHLMRNISYLFIAALIPMYCLCLNAQAVAAGDTSSNHAKTALTFFVNGLYLSGGIGGKFYTSSNFAIRASLGLSYSQEKDLSSEVITTTTSIATTVYFLYHFGKYSGLSPYVGAGVGATYYQYRSNDYGRILESGSASVPFVGGVEYWLTDHITFAAEQSIQLLYNISSSNRSIRVSSSNPSLLLSLYF
jgi:hypothetical protein